MQMRTTPPEARTTVAMQLVRGFCMGVADIIPGVSGGTIALIFGIYARLVANIRTGARSLGRLVRGDVAGFARQLRSIELAFLIPLLTGIGIAFLSLSHLIEDLLHDHPEEMAGLFLGLVAASVVIAMRMVRRWDALAIGLLVAVSVASFALLGLQTGAVSSPSSAQVAGAGVIAICAMILPGISGSFLLLMMGMYAPLLTAVNERDLAIVTVFLLSAVVGLALFSTLLSWLLETHHDPVLAALIGLMVGSIRVLWPWPNGVGIISDVPSEVITGTTLGRPHTFTEFLWPTVLAVVAAAAVLALSTFADQRQLRREAMVSVPA